MQYVSCADVNNNKKKYTFKEAVFSGWAEDGGMIVPEIVPKVDKATLIRWGKLQYPELCFEILSLFISDNDIPRNNLKEIIVEKSFKRFGNENIVNIEKNILNHNNNNNNDSNNNKDEISDNDNNKKRGKIHIVELWHGPTLAFKDLGMQVLGQILMYFISKNNNNNNNNSSNEETTGKIQKTRKLNLLVGTSGDTGSSAIEAVREFKNFIDICVLYPKGRGISLLQELQMTTVGEVEDNVKVIAIEGSSDDLDVPIEALFADLAFKEKYNLGSVNSVNICRVLVQVVHFFYAYLKICPLADRCDDIAFSIPTGAAGHLSAGVIACKMGLPIKHLHAATNSNDVLHRILSTGSSVTTNNNNKDNLNVASSAKTTIAPSMDIVIPYNLERLLYFATSGDSKLCKAAMHTFRSTGNITLSEKVKKSFREDLFLFSSSSTDQNAIDATIKVYNDSSNMKYVLDPHTACGVSSALSDPSFHAMNEIICMACAHPSKFPKTTSSTLMSMDHIKKDEKKGNNKNIIVDENNDFWWLNKDDQAHVNIKTLLELQGGTPIAELYSLNEKHLWETKLRNHFIKRDK